MSYLKFTDNDKHDRITRVWQKWRVLCSADSFVVAASSVLRINTCLPAGRFVVKGPPIAYLQNISGNSSATATDSKLDK